MTKEDEVGKAAAIILAGGLGTRLKSVVSDRPKPLALVQGRPFLYFLLDQIWKAGVREVVVCIGYRAEQVREEIGDTYREMKVRYVEEKELLGTGGAIRNALSQVKMEKVFILNGDSYCGVNLRRFYQWTEKVGYGFNLVGVEVEDVSRFGTIEMAKEGREGRVTAFREKEGIVVKGIINAGIYITSVKYLLSIPENRVVSLEREMFPLWIERGMGLYKSQGQFIDIGTPSSYHRINTSKFCFDVE